MSGQFPFEVNICFFMVCINVGQRIGFHNYGTIFPSVKFPCIICLSGKDLISYRIIDHAMEIEIVRHQNMAVAKIHTNQVLLKNEQDAVELIANCRYQGADKIILKADQIHPDFFKLKTRLAGDTLQKFTNYQCHLAIIGDFEIIHSNSLRDFIRESNRAGRINFVRDEKAALESLLRT